MYRQYTKCFPYPDGTGKPFNTSDLVALGLVDGGALGGLFGLLTGLVVGFAVGGPVGAIVGAIVGTFAAVFTGAAMAITEAANKWLYHRLVCLGGDQCAIGTVSDDPHDDGLGAFDNDEFFDLLPMPYPGDDVWRYAAPSDNYLSDKPGIVDPSVQPILDDHPLNDVLIGNPQGIALIRPQDSLKADLGYDTSHNWLHCEAEGNFWVEMLALVDAIAALLALLAAATVAAGIGGGIAGAAIACAVAGVFTFGIACLIGIIVGVLVGLALAGAASAGIAYAALQGVYDSDPGDVEDANIGDHSKGPIQKGDRVAVFGTHVYDGFHEGWHELHPLKAVIRISDFPGHEASAWLQWAPQFADGDPLPADLPDMPPEIRNLTPEDMRQGMKSDKFARRAAWLKARWCEMLHEAFDPGTRQRQQSLDQRWTIHPAVDGCTPPSSAGPEIH